MDVAVEMNKINEKIKELREKAEVLLKTEYRRAYDKRTALADLYLEARDWKSDGNLWGMPIGTVIKYDNQTILYFADLVEQAENEMKEEQK